MKILIINNTEPTDNNFNIPLFKSIARFAEIDIIGYQTLSSHYIDQGLINGVVLSGVPLYYPAEVITDRAARLGWLKNSTVPVLGICLGHQSIAKAFGASIRQGLEAEAGPISIRISPAGLIDPLLAHIPDPNFEASAIHSCSTTLPENFVRLASSDACQNQIIKHLSKPLYGVQFHPELSQTGIALIKNFIEIAKQPLNVEPGLLVA
jgi:GMP synthase (glutamine-hydrolysing)